MNENQNINDIGTELGWDDTIEKESADFILLPEGDYQFTVKSFERARHPGSDKLPPCNKAIIFCEIKDALGTVSISKQLFLHTKTEGLLSSFFSSIGQKKKGEKLQMNWASVIGATGRCKVGIRDWVSEKGETMHSNEIKRFYPNDEPSAPTFQAGGF